MLQNDNKIINYSDDANVILFILKMVHLVLDCTHFLTQVICIKVKEAVVFHINGYVPFESKNLA